MVDMNTSNSDQLTLVLMLVSPLVGLITERTIHLALMKTNGEPKHRLDALNRFTCNDITIFTMTLITSGFVVLMAMRIDGPQYVMNYLTTARRDAAVVGWGMTIIWWMHCLAPAIVALALMIGRRKRRNEYGDRWDLMKENGFFMG